MIEVAGGEPGPVADCHLDQRDSGDPVRICYLIDNLDVAGTEQHLLRLVRGLDQTAFQPVLVLLDGSGARSQRLEPAECPVHRLQVKSFRSPAILSSILKFARFLKRENVDILEMYFPDSTLFGALSGRLAGVPVRLRTRRNAGYWMTGSHRWRGRLVSRLVQWTIANNEISRDTVIEQEKASRESVIVIPNGVDTQRFAEAAERRRPEPTGPARIGMLANLRPVKRIGDFISAATRLLEQRDDVEFVVAGEGPCREALQQQIKQTPFAGPIRLVGVVEDVPEFLGQLDMLVVCSESEGLSNSVLESMAAGLPVVATDVEGNRTLLADGQRGLLWPVGDVTALATAISRLVDDPVLAHALGQAGRDYVQQHCSQRNMIGQYQSVYRRLVNQVKPGGRR